MLTVKNTVSTKMVLILFALLLTKVVYAKSSVTVETENVVVCPAENNLQVIPDFTQANCQATSIYELDPQNNALWFKTEFIIPKAYLEREQPSALYFFGKMSSTVYLNGEQLGNNGIPSKIAEQEFPGNMDTKFYVPRSLLKQGKNEIVVFASSHHGFLQLARPLHYIVLTEHGETNKFFKQDLFISLCILGALLLGCVYLTPIVLQSEERKSTLLILLMALFSSAQLFTEISRALFNYSYPVHDLRLILITFLAFCVGVCFLSFSIYKFALKAQRIWWLVSVGITAFIVMITPGFDNKTTLALLCPALFSFILAVLNYRKLRTKEVLAYVLVYGVFNATVIYTFTTFHTLYFYYIVTAMMAFLIVRKANEFVKEKVLRKAEEQQVLKLQLTIDHIQQQHSPSKLAINSAGKTEFIQSTDISYCKAAGDYVSIFLTSTREILYSGTLKSIEGKLPSTFLKVHRSYIVNLDEVASVVSAKASQSSSGALEMKNNDQIPISRRILPKVRGVINEVG